MAGKTQNSGLVIMVLGWLVHMLAFIRLVQETVSNFARPGFVYLSLLKRERMKFGTDI